MLVDSVCSYRLFSYTCMPMINIPDTMIHVPPSQTHPPMNTCTHTCILASKQTNMMCSGELLISQEVCDLGFT